MNRNIVLTGFMGTGKTAVGKELARLLQMKLVDVDAEIEKAEQMTINEIFGRYGEARFREIETAMIRQMAQGKKLIISTGGGAVLRAENMEALRKNGDIFCLWAGPETVFRRIADNEDRPLLKVEDPMARIRELLEYRRPYYESAGRMIDTEDKTPLQVAEEIMELYRCGQ